MIYGIEIGPLIGPAILVFNTLLMMYATRQIKKVEIATNSMKDALVQATGEKEHAKGVIVGRGEAFAESKETEIKS